MKFQDFLKFKEVSFSKFFDEFRPAGKNLVDGKFRCEIFANFELASKFM